MTTVAGLDRYSMTSSRKVDAAIGGAGPFGADTSDEGLGATSLGMAAIAVTVADAAPVVGQVLSGAAIVLDADNAWKAFDACK